MGSGSGRSTETAIKLVDTWESEGEGLVFGPLSHVICDGFEVHNMILDCNSANNPKYAEGEPVWIVIPLAATARVDTVTLRWNDGQLPSSGYIPWHLGAAREFEICARVPGTIGYVTNCSAFVSTGAVDVVPVGTEADQLVVRLTRRTSGVDFYSLSVVELFGAM